LLAAVVSSFVGVSARRGMAQEEVQTNAEIVDATAHDSSPALHSMPIVPPRQNPVVIPLHRRPGPAIVGNGFDDVLQTLPMAKVGTTNVLSFNGISDRDRVAPPDTNASVGATHVLSDPKLSNWLTAPLLVCISVFGWLYDFWSEYRTQG